MSNLTYKEVRFDKYCRKCLYSGVPEAHDPCNSCLAHGMNEGTEKPIEYKEYLASDISRRAVKEMEGRIEAEKEVD